MKLVPIVALVLAAVAPAHAATLNLPDDITGLWTGNCTQVETNVQVGMLATMDLQSPTLILGDWRSDGTFFGCVAGDYGGYPLFKGGKREGWSTHALHINSKSNVGLWGHVVAHSKGTTFIVKGKKACDGAGPKSYGGKGTLTDGVFTLNLKGKVDGELAHFTCTWTRRLT